MVELDAVDLLQARRIAGEVVSLRAVDLEVAESGSDDAVDPRQPWIGRADVDLLDDAAGDVDRSVDELSRDDHGSR